MNTVLNCDNRFFGLLKHFCKNLSSFPVEIRGPYEFIEGPEWASDPESRSKISNLLRKELFYSCILKMKKCFLHTISFRHIQLSVIHRLTKNGFSDPKRFRAFEKHGCHGYWTFT